MTNHSIASILDAWATYQDLLSRFPRGRTMEQQEAVTVAKRRFDSICSEAGVSRAGLQEILQEYDRKRGRRE